MRVSYLWLARAFFLLLGVQKEEYSGVFIAENAHRCGSLSTPTGKML
jgi:hypothetical protein